MNPNKLQTCDNIPSIGEEVLGPTLKVIIRVLNKNYLFNFVQVILTGKLSFVKEFLMLTILEF